MILSTITGAGSTTHKVEAGRYVIMASGTLGDGPATIAVLMNGVTLKSAGGIFCQEFALPTGTLTFTVATSGSAPAIVVQIDRIY